MVVAVLLLFHFLCAATTHITNRSDAFIIAPVTPQRSNPSTGATCNHRGFFMAVIEDRLEHRTALLSVPPNDSSDDDDDGWAADGDDADLNASTVDKKKNSSQINKELQLATIADLQQSRRRRPASSSSSSRQLKGDGGQADIEAEERDLFIPLFALISLAGLFGAYGYEMIRLYLRGELYLPGAGS
jgi:hypothetical protein